MSLRPISFLFQTKSRQDVPDAAIYNPTFTAWLNGKPLVGAIKTWVDENPPKDADPVDYPVLIPDNAIGTLRISAGGARVLNLPGHPDYPHYAYVESKATFNGSPLPFKVCELKDAQALATELGAAAPTDLMLGFAGIFPLVYPPDDSRRAWSVAGSEAARLIAMKNANGIGSPGHWDQSSGTPVWVADLPSPAPDAQTLPVPLVAFPAGAKLVPGSIVTGGLAMLDVPDSSSSNPTGDSLFTPSRAAIVDRLGAWLQKFGV